MNLSQSAVNVPVVFNTQVRRSKLVHTKNFLPFLLLNFIFFLHYIDTFPVHVELVVCIYSCNPSFCFLILRLGTRHSVYALIKHKTIAPRQREGSALALGTSGVPPPRSAVRIPITHKKFCLFYFLIIFFFTPH